MTIAKFDFIATALFVVATALGASLFGSWKYLAAGVAGAMFLVGCVVFLMAFARAVQRSRTDAIGIGGLYFLAGSVAPNQVTRTFNGLLAVQCVAAVAGAAIRPYSAMAFGVLAPMLGLALSGLWGAKFGEFGSRSVSRVGKEREAASDRPE